MSTHESIRNIISHYTNPLHVLCFTHAMSLRQTAMVRIYERLWRAVFVSKELGSLKQSYGTRRDDIYR